MEDLYILVASEAMQDSWFRRECSLLAAPGGESGLLSDPRKRLKRKRVYYQHESLSLRSAA
jgi:hypothetical protein